MKLYTCVIFGSTHICEQTFSTINLNNKSKVRSNLTKVHLQSINYKNFYFGMTDLRQSVNNLSRPQVSLNSKDEDYDLFCNI